MFQRPFRFQRIIIISLIIFSSLPIIALQVFQLVTLPQTIQSNETQRFVNSVDQIIDNIKDKIFSDSIKSDQFSQNSVIYTYLGAWKSKNVSVITQLQPKVEFEISQFYNTSFDYQNDPNTIFRNRVLEVGVVGFDVYAGTNYYLGNDKLSLAIKMQTTNSTLHYTFNETITDPSTYLPYSTIALHNDKVRVTSSIIPYENFNTGQDILNGTKKQPVNFHSFYVINRTSGTPIGLVYTVFSAVDKIELMNSFDSPQFPALLIDNSGSIIYSSDANEQFTQISVYYSTIIYQYGGYGTTQVDNNGYKGDITLYRQIAMDRDNAYSMYLFKLVPKSEIFQSLITATIQAAIILVIFLILATTLSYYTTRGIINRLQKLTNAANQISKGDFSPEIDVRGKDAITELAKSFDRMKKSLKYSMADLEEDET